MRIIKLYSIIQVELNNDLFVIKREIMFLLKVCRGQSCFQINDQFFQIKGLIAYEVSPQTIINIKFTNNIKIYISISIMSLAYNVDDI